MQYAVPRVLFRAGRLRRLFTDLDGRSAAFRWLRLLPRQSVPRAIARIMDRSPQEIPQSLTTAFNALGVRYAWRRRAARSRSQLTGLFLAVNRDFCRRVCRCDWEDAQAVYTFNAAALEVLELARQRGLRPSANRRSRPTPSSSAFWERNAHCTLAGKRRTRTFSARSMSSAKKPNGPLGHHSLCLGVRPRGGGRVRRARPTVQGRAVRGRFAPGGGVR